jgi:thiamine-phosphate diphosphorylase / hydroxyethylthiazole kinase
MSPYGDEAASLASNGGALVVNMGTLSADSFSHYVKAVQAYNEFGGPVVFDPVGAAATVIRRTTVGDLMSEGYLDLVKGNEGELREVFSRNGVGGQHGVDSGPSRLNDREKATLVRDLARRERTFQLHAR